MDDSSLVEVFAARDAGEAHLVRNRLEDAGIRARVVGAGLQQAGGEVPVGWVIAPRVWVFAHDEARACEIIAELEQARPSDLPPWTCPQCGEEVEGHFDICWNCQHSKN